MSKECTHDRPQDRLKLERLGLLDQADPCGDGHLQGSPQKHPDPLLTLGPVSEPGGVGEVESRVGDGEEEDRGQGDGKKEAFAEFRRRQSTIQKMIPV